MGEVVRARDPKLDREVALKVLPAKAIGDARARERLIREARAAAKLAHAGIVHVYDVGETEEGGAFLVMELVHGINLRDLVARGGAGVAEILRVIVECARALAFAHRAGAVHRDVKPDNIMIRDDGRAALLDFGLAKSLTADLVPLTDEGLVLGTPAYLAPEQACGGEVDGRADQFALAVTAYEALTGRLPWSGTSVAAVLAEILRDRAQPPSTLAPRLPEELDAVLARAMQKSPADRYRDLDAFADALQEVAAVVGPSPMATPASLARTEALPSRRIPPSAPPKMGKASLAAVVLGLLVLTGIGVVWVVRTNSSTSSAPVSAPSAAPSEAATAITDLPMPRSTSLEALAAYREGIQATREGNVLAMANDFKRACTLDPTMAAAFWRYADIGYAIGDTAGAREALAHALLQRSALSPRDLAVAESYEALLRRSPPDAQEYERLRSAIAAQYPLDAEVALDLGWASFLAEHYEQAERQARRALELDPEFTFAWRCVGLSLESRGMAQEARDAYSSCTTQWPSATSCLADYGIGVGYEGRCDEYDQKAEQLHAVQADNLAGLSMRASILARTGAPNDTLHAAITEWGGALRYGKLSAELVEDRYDLWTGDFASIDARRAERDAALEGAKELSTQSGFAASLVTALRESGRDAEAGKVATAFLGKRPLLNKGRWGGDLSDEHSGVVLGAARAAGVVSAAAWRKTTREWLDEWSKIAPRAYSRFEAWLVLFASEAVTRQDADEALAAMPSHDVLNPDGLGAPALGHLYLLLGRWDEAIAQLEAAVRACAVLDDVRSLVRAHYELAQAYETQGDTDEACEHHAWVVARWKGAKPRSVTAEAAARRMGALGCAGKAGGR
jgi:serine/threonine-protein kinase